MSFRSYISTHEEVLAEEVIELLWNRFPEYGEVFDEAGKAECRKDVKYHFLYLTDAVDTDSLTLFIQYVQWVKQLFASLSVPDESFVESLKVMREVLAGRDTSESEGEKERALGYLDESIRNFSHLPEKQESLIREDNPMAELAREYLEALLNRERGKAMKLVLSKVDEGADIRDIYEYVFQETQREIGRLWQENRISVAQEHYCTAVTQLVMSRLYPNIFDQEKNGLVFLGAGVGDELHELGIRMIADFFELDGWDTHFLGANTPEESVVETVSEVKADVVGLSVTITYHLHKVQNIIRMIRERPDLQGVKILVGGYPFNRDPELWKKVDADGYAATAREAISTARHLVGRPEGYK